MIRATPLPRWIPGTEIKITYVRDNKIQQATATYGVPRGRR